MKKEKISCVGCEEISEEEINEELKKLRKDKN